MKVEATYAQVWKIAFPIMLGSIAQTVLNVTDTAFMARVGEASLAASAIGGVFYYVLVMVGISFSIGAQIVLSRRAGEGDREGIRATFQQAFVLLLFTGLFLFFVGHFGVHWLFTYTINDAEVREQAVTFVLYRSYGLLLLVPLLSVRAFLVGISETKLITVQSVISCVVNLIIGYVLIFGKGGFGAMGIAGAGIASAIAEWVSSLFVLLVVRYYKKFRGYQLFHSLTTRGTIIQNILHISLPVLMQNTLSMGAWLLFFMLIEKLGTHELAISNVVRAVYMILMTPVFGFSSAANAMTANLIGQGRAIDVRGLLIKISIFSVSIITLLTLLCFIFTNQVLGVVTNDAGIISDARISFYIVCAASISLAVSLVLLSAVSGSGATRAALVIEFVNIAIYVAFIYICCINLKTKVEVVWLSEILYWVLMGVMAYFYLRSGKWKSIKV